MTTSLSSSSMSLPSNQGKTKHGKKKKSSSSRRKPTKKEPTVASLSPSQDLVVAVGTESSTRTVPMGNDNTVSTVSNKKSNNKRGNNNNPPKNSNNSNNSSSSNNNNKKTQSKPDNAVKSSKDELPKFTSRLFVVAPWKILFVLGIVLIGISAAALVAHVHAKQQQQEQTAQHDKIATADDYYFYDTSHGDDIFVQHDDDNDTNPCGPRVWPGVVGKHVNEARDIILAQNPCVVVIILSIDQYNGSHGDAYYDPERVRLYMHPHTGLVERIPRVG